MNWKLPGYVYWIPLGVFLYLLPYVVVRAQEMPPDLKFRKYGLEDGLSQVTSHCIIEDNDGFMWIGTQDGLNRFDGHEFKVFRHDPDQPSSISDSHVRDLLQDSQGYIWVATNGGLNLFNKTTEEFIYWRHDENNQFSLSHNNVLDVFEDSQSRLWVGTEHGLNLLDRINGTFRQYFADRNDSTTLSNNLIHSITEDDQGALWIGTAHGLNHFDPAEETFTAYFHDPVNENSLSHNRISRVFYDAFGILWVGTRKGLNALNIESGTIRRFIHDPHQANSISGDYILSFLEDDTQQLWVGTAQDGLNLFDRSTQSFYRYQYKPGDAYSISNNTVWTITEDSKHNLWIGVSSKGFNYVDRKTEQFKHYRQVVNDPQSLLHNAVRAILLDQEDNLWVGSFLGLNVFSEEEQRNVRYQHQSDKPYSLTNSYVRSLLQDGRQQIWVGTESGLNLYQPDSKLFSHGIKDATGKTYLKDEVIWTLYEDFEGMVWIGTNEGLYCWIPETAEIKHYTYSVSDSTSLSHPFVRSVYQDKKGSIWVGTEIGLNLMDQKAGVFKRFLHDRGDLQTLSNNTVNGIAEDSLGHIWVATAGGLNLLDRETGQFQIWREKQGLSNDVIYGMLADTQGHLWLSTNRGINYFNTEEQRFYNYDKSDGLQSDEFNTGAFYKDRNGTMYFGGVNGLSVFHPDSIEQEPCSPKVVFTDFLLFNKPVRIGDSSVLVAAIDRTSEITIDYGDDLFAFEFAALDYQHPEKVQYAFKLEPYDNDWVYTDHKDRKAVYTRVPAGTYTFRLKALREGAWEKGDRNIILHVLPPWWQAWWAYTSYVVLMLTIVYLVIRFQWKRIQLKQHLELEKRDAEQLKTLDRLKTQFFSNITHEFRTPLTLIIGPVEQMLNQKDLDDGAVRKQLGLIKRSSQKFLHMVNQLLDLSKLEDNKMTIEHYQGNMKAFIESIVENFRMVTEQKHIELVYGCELSSETYVFDRISLDKIIYNLLSNAVKFTEEAGSIEVKISDAHLENQQSVQLTVEDNGVGIDPDSLPYIFDRFYQVDGTMKRKREGSGIGLALTRELVELLGGTIDVRSKPGIGTTFNVIFPVNQVSPDLQASTGGEMTLTKAPFEIPFPELAQEELEEEHFDQNSDQPSLLIIEDNDDLRTFIKVTMENDYQVQSAKNGSEGVTKAFRHIPDLIISDVMMPEMDGFEVSRLIKQHQLTSHVPIILLTAKSNLESRLQGYKTGADAYLTKPFNTEELQLLIRKLIESRRKLQERYSEGEINNEQQDEYFLADLDRTLIENLHNLIEDRLSNEDLVVDDLVQESGMSHSQLYRKIKALTDLSIAGFITNYRLTRALHLLREGTYNVTQVAYMTGFSNRRYFHRVFVEKFKSPPSKFRKVDHS